MQTPARQRAPGAVTAVIGLILSLPLAAPGVSGEERPFAATPYRVGLFLQNKPGRPMEPVRRRELVEAVTARCEVLIGKFWHVEFLASELCPPTWTRPDEIADVFKDYDKIFLVGLEMTTASRQLRVREFDVKTAWLSPEGFFPIEDAAKTVDTLVAALFGRFAPVARLEKSDSKGSLFRVQGARLFTGPVDDESYGGIPVSGGVLLPFVRSLDRDGRPTAHARIPWTALLTEHVDARTGLLHARMLSGLPDPLSARRRGRTEIYALHIPTPMTPTTLRFRPRIAAKDEPGGLPPILPGYDLFELLPDRGKPIPLGRTRAGGVFDLAPEPDRAVRMFAVKSGRTVLARFPIVRGLESEVAVTVPDDAVRLEAEAALLAMQEEWLDVAARREIMLLRLKNVQETGDAGKEREIRNDLARLKSVDRFLIDLEQARLRFRSDDPIVDRRIDKMFRDTKNAFAGN